MRRPAAPGELAVSLGGLALALFLAVETWRLPVGPAHALIGPRFFPGLVACGLGAAALVLIWQALTGGWRPRPEVAEPRPDLAAITLVVAGLLLQATLLKATGFVISASLLFAAAARGFGSRALLRDLVTGALLAGVLHFGMSRGLGLAVPTGWVWGGG